MKEVNKLFKWTKKHLTTLVVVLFLAAFAPFTYSYVPQFIKYIFDKVLATESSKIGLPSFVLNYFGTFDGIKAILIIGTFLLFYQTFRGVILFANGFFRGKLSEGIAYDIRNDMYRHIQNLSYNYHTNADTGDLIQRCTSDIETIQAFVANQLPQLVSIFAQFTFGAIQMSLINSYLVISSVVLAPISIVLSIIFFRYIKNHFEIVEEIESEMTSFIQENINGARVVKAFNAEIDEINKFKNISEKYQNELIKINKIDSLYWSLTDIFSLLQYVITIAVSIYFAKGGVMTTGDIIAALMYIGMLVWPIRGLGSIISDFGRAIVANNRIDEILKTVDEYVNDGTMEPEITGDIEFRDVKYSYSTNTDLLNGVSFTIKPGQTVALIGKTGAGKSTIASLLTRLIDADEGDIFLDGVNIKDIKKDHVRENIGLVLQDPFLFAKTVYENISIAQPKINQNEVIRAAQTAAIHTDISSFDSGYQTIVGEKGVTLSGGQKQRIAIARMLLLHKPVVIFDDSLSAVDTTTDLLIRQALKNANQKLTSIIITHRITTAKEADLIIVLDKGKVCEIGNHQELVNTKGLYQSLWDIQGELESSFIEEYKDEKDK